MVISLEFVQKQPLEVFFEKKVFLKVLQISQENTYVGVFCNFLKKRPQNRCFHVKFAKLIGTPILKNIWKRLLLFVFVFTESELEDASTELGVRKAFI